MTQYEFNGEVYNTKVEAEEAVYSYAEEHYDEMLDEIYEKVKICGLSYSASIALYRVDPIAYRVGIDDYADSLYGDIEEVEAEEDEE